MEYSVKNPGKEKCLACRLKYASQEDWTDYIQTGPRNGNLTSSGRKRHGGSSRRTLSRVVRVKGPVRSYEVSSKDGLIRHRHIDQLRRGTLPLEPEDLEDPVGPETEEPLLAATTTVPTEPRRLVVARCACVSGVPPLSGQSNTLAIREMLSRQTATFYLCQPVAGLNGMAQDPNVPVLRILSAHGAETSLSGVDYEAPEEEDMKELVAPQWLVGDSGRVESQLKKPSQSESGKKNLDKPKKGGKKGKGKKKKNRTPCDEDFKNFCIHGECKYIEHLQIPTCKCHPNYYGERCIEQFLKSHRSNEAASQSATLLVVVAVVFSVFTFAVVVAIVIRQVRKKYPKCEEKEEKKKLRQENGSSSTERDEVEEAVDEA
ncbi:PREDICTED: amphiregulin [Gekko japonicus]|uniref:Amphiregulin n=1 Tax=Gekko japonicus TaxID=146911 RepID=A0ABM1JLU7_GEKJA|nr:PREDICTED: amphiregulin [Gekko japonicus]